jgi:pantoate--beta-alanine ligase
MTKIVHTIAQLQACLPHDKPIAFVPTMGNLHAGHLSLLRQAKGAQNCVVASIFVNPLQFSVGEDFERYPRTVQSDSEQLDGLVDVLFIPSIQEIYPVSQTVFVELPPIANELCGSARTGHFRGMATVVLKLMHLVRPQVVWFGKKDYQQLHIIQQMVTQLNLPMVVKGGETVRAADGLALSSRNQYLSETERVQAARLYQILQKIGYSISQGANDFAALEQEAIQTLSHTGWEVDYVSVRNQSDLCQANLECAEWVILAAARLGNTRLIDNLELSLGL